MEYTATPIGRPNPLKLDKKILRNCIACHSEEYQSRFDFTYEHLTRARNLKADWLKEIGWGAETSSSVVRCKNCGVHYVRDVFPAFEQEKEEYSDEKAESVWKLHNRKKNFSNHVQSMGLIHTLIALAIKEFDSELKVLDFGAGAGSWCNRFRAFGVSQVDAYEPFAPYHPRHYAKNNFPGIFASRDWERFQERGPYHIVICNGAFEHFADPDQEVKRMKSVMMDGGFLYLNNPFDRLITQDFDTIKRLEKVVKKNRESHIHPGHLNYFTPKQFVQYTAHHGLSRVKIGTDSLLPRTSRVHYAKRVIKDGLIAAGLYSETHSFIFKKD